MDVSDVASNRAVLLDSTKTIAQRSRALFNLRSIGTMEAAQVLMEAISNSSALLKHEICYGLGQMGLADTWEFLKNIIEDAAQEPIVRHEAAEALGAIGTPQAREVLERYSQYEVQEIAETCQIALGRLGWLQSGGVKKPNQFTVAVDPAPAFEEAKSYEELLAIYNDPGQSIYTRYRALFSLRDLATPEAIESIAKGLIQPHFSPLFKHEIAFVLGELSDLAKDSSSYLAQALSEKSNLCMVRHEASEALGEVDPSPATQEILRSFLEDESEVVRQSCEVALGIADYALESRGG